MLVSYSGATVAAAAQPSTTPAVTGDTSDRHVNPFATADGVDTERPDLPDGLDAALTDASLETGLSDLSTTVTVGGEEIVHLSGVFAQMPIGDGAPGLLVAAGYQRRSTSSTLENETRSELYETVRESPGSYLSELATELDVSVSTVRYHARILKNNRIVAVAETAGKHRLYPVGGTDPVLLAALDEKSTARILHAVERLGPVTVSSLATDLDLADSTVSYHLNRLHDAGLVTRERVGRTVLTELTPPVDAVVSDDSARSPR
ncbi:winged helix-turn-helix transcriptional regulator [Halogranum rubrum]|uniref:HTH arsR-type domain-containing protein n=1 Tax=Halogranum salarium B-1 TaxID=1210908 RepID=J3A5U5_9EURY|nr:ArsR family transcriptional regulator [Halogranum salarium]EJN60843.1 hypothetical protein HSB1_14460 [Halogranum salarium B-1]